MKILETVLEKPMRAHTVLKVKKINAGFGDYFHVAVWQQLKNKEEIHSMDMAQTFWLAENALAYAILLEKDILYHWEKIASEEEKRKVLEEDQLVFDGVSNFYYGSAPINEQLAGEE